MTTKTSKPLAGIVKCSVCGREIPPGGNGVPCDYVWRNGKNYCWGCIKYASQTNAKSR